MTVHGGKVCLRFENYTMLGLPQTCPCGSWAWGVSNAVMPYECPWWKSSFEFWNLYHVYGYRNAFASPILPIWLSLFAKSTWVVFMLWSSHPHCHIGNSPKATLSFGLPNVLWATPYLECIERSMWKVFEFNFMFCLCSILTKHLRCKPIKWWTINHSHPNRWCGWCVKLING
jgi:hypothetical protein